MCDDGLKLCDWRHGGWKLHGWVAVVVVVATAVAVVATAVAVVAIAVVAVEVDSAMEQQTGLLC